MNKDREERSFTEEDMRKAFEAGSEWECWSLRGTREDKEEPYFDEWIEKYKKKLTGGDKQIIMGESKVNNTESEGMAIISQEPNGVKSWKAELTVPETLFDEPYYQWGGKEIVYKGPFKYQDKIINGTGEAFITVPDQLDPGKVIIEIQGMNKPDLEEDTINNSGLIDISEIIEQRIAIAKGEEHQVDFRTTLENAERLAKICEDREKVTIGINDYEAIIRGINIEGSNDPDNKVSIELFLLGV